MKPLADVIIHFLELLEAEGKTLRQGIVKVGIALAFLVGVALLLCGGLGLIGWAIYLFLRLGLSPDVSALLDGLIVIFLAVILLWIAKLIAR